MAIGRGARWLLWPMIVAFIIGNIMFVKYRFMTKRTGLRADLRPVNPIDARLRLVATLHNETILESIDRLPNFDDTVWVAGDIEPDSALSQRSYRYQTQFVPSLNRVRKVLNQFTNEGAEAGEAKERLISHVARATNGFGDILDAKLREISRSDAGVVLSEPDKYWTSIVDGPAAAYLISELNIQEALPVFIKLLARSDELPVNRVFLFFAAHQLVVSHSASGLSAQSRRLLNQYLALTVDLPKAEKRDVLSWDSRFEIDDYRLLILHRDIPELKSSKVQVSFYPAELHRFDTQRGGRNPKLEEYIVAMSAFVTSVYGN